MHVITLKKLPNCFSKWLYINYILASRVRSSSSISSVTFAIIFLVVAFSVAVKWYVIMILICISLMSKIQHLFICLFTNHMYSLEVTVQIFCSFLIGLSSFYWVVRVLYSRYKFCVGYIICTFKRRMQLF